MFKLYIVLVSKKGRNDRIEQLKILLMNIHITLYPRTLKRMSPPETGRAKQLLAIFSIREPRIFRIQNQEKLYIIQKLKKPINMHTHIHTHTHTHTHIYIYIYIYQHHGLQLARISLTISLHSSLFSIALGRSSMLHPVSVQRTVVNRF